MLLNATEDMLPKKITYKHKKCNNKIKDLQLFNNVTSFFWNWISSNHLKICHVY